ncbi:hypothetical protein [Thermocrinis minervae]|uniref:Uncharacterized protein n=1 Tax=Thermocrinis minervae TaxID=381751 RepID=A0A1M6SF76_9AQUI|nr:hypothetical protein [Thermocrinis minervae]SHK43412.1 hypothetical protein SAMN05444391_1012 [Thermocrinis minervae]
MASYKSYYKELKEYVLSLKGVPFLSPKEKLYLQLLEREGYPLEIVKAAISKHYMSLPQEERSKSPLYASFHILKRLASKKDTKEKGYESWREVFYQKIKQVEGFLKMESVPEPKDESQAQEILQSLESKLVKELWEKLSDEEKKAILKKFSSWKNNQELYRLLVKQEVLRRFGLKPFSLYVK